MEDLTVSVHLSEGLERETILSVSEDIVKINALIELVDLLFCTVNDHHLLWVLVPIMCVILSLSEFLLKQETALVSYYLPLMIVFVLFLFRTAR